MVSRGSDAVGQRYRGSHISFGFWVVFEELGQGLYRFLAIAVLLDVRDIPQVGPLHGGGSTPSWPPRFT
jgi:hypothetical protein